MSCRERSIRAADSFAAATVLRWFRATDSFIRFTPPALHGRVPGVSDELDRALLRGLEKEPRRRPHLAGAYAGMIRVVNRHYGEAA